ncbi:MAG: Ureidoglycolate lyase [Chrysothrix sp. TS-e1954]|nr:MAG: Ureidoglycolate lyase [Chrysothrix sp. TS-e1954]
MYQIITALDSMITPETLSQEAFSQFGTVIERPSTDATSPRIVLANQASAVKTLDITELFNHYPSASHDVPAKPVINMFTCYPRNLLDNESKTPRTAQERLACGNGPQESQVHQQYLFSVKVLERHPYTPQTFIPLGLAASNPDTLYLVIVAPTLSVRAEQSRHSSAASRLDDPTRLPCKGGAPDLSRLRAFVARGNQAVTYGAGTWHAPMVVLGATAVDFVVLQYANGVQNDDCEEITVELEDTHRNGVQIVVELNAQRPASAKL